MNNDVTFENVSARPGSEDFFLIGEWSVGASETSSRASLDRFESVLTVESLVKIEEGRGLAAAAAGALVVDELDLVVEAVLKAVMDMRSFGGT
mmetsp:Transcript_45118/g.130271  ORF Transcript_45118/g.130271 Transcript_45118/m.130271 type:complete len:93 (+) Transcript_45118:1720-1998(+)